MKGSSLVINYRWSRGTKTLGSVVEASSKRGVAEECSWSPSLIVLLTLFPKEGTSLAGN